MNFLETAAEWSASEAAWSAARATWASVVVNGLVVLVALAGIGLSLLESSRARTREMQEKLAREFTHPVNSPIQDYVCARFKRLGLTEAQIWQTVGHEIRCMKIGPIESAKLKTAIEVALKSARRSDPGEKLEKTF